MLCWVAGFFQDKAEDAKARGEVPKTKQELDKVDGAWHCCIGLGKLCLALLGLGKRGPGEGDMGQQVLISSPKILWLLCSTPMQAHILHNC